jgi:hypothetical protein
MGMQTPPEPIDVSNWAKDDEFPEYPVGAREKFLLFSPEAQREPFLVAGHQYLFKLAFKRHPDQFWAEIIAHRIGTLMGVDVPPAHLATRNGVTGALIEWFYDHPGKPNGRMLLAGEYFQRRIEDFDRKKGTQHNLQTAFALCRDMNELNFIGDWQEWWVKTLVFDSLIGNTDRHQDNWGFVFENQGDDQITCRLTPVFDNGTSLGYEILARNFADFEDADRLLRYIERGRHHARWRKQDSKRIRFVDTLPGLASCIPGKERLVRTMLQFSENALRQELMHLTAFNAPVALSEERARFVLHLVLNRRKVLLESLGG